MQLILTHRQKEVLELLANGESNKSISHHLNISENTVKVHVTAILKILGVCNRTKAALALEKIHDSASSQPPEEGIDLPDDVLKAYRDILENIGKLKSL